MEDAVCAPGVNFIGGSCITLDVLEDMIVAYNSEHDDKIDVSPLQHLKINNPITYKKHLVEMMKERMKKYKCDTQTCWLTLPFFKKLSDLQRTKKLHKYTFRPVGPKNTNEWLNTYNINHVFEQYEKFYPDFQFMGANPRDFDDLPATRIKDLDYRQLLKKGIDKIGFVFNLDRHDESGSHWVSMFVDLKKHQIYFFDSVGHQPEREFVVLMNRIRNFMKHQEEKSGGDYHHKIDMRHNIKQHQRGNSECGVYAISFILRMLDGETFDEIISERITDEEIKLCRKEYFRQK